MTGRVGSRLRAGVPGQQSAPNREREQSQTGNSLALASHTPQPPAQSDCHSLLGGKKIISGHSPRHINASPLPRASTSLPGRVMAHYSSLFTLGLLSDRASPPSSPKSNIFYKFRKSSLPTRSISKPSSHLYPTTPLDGLNLPAPQFTNPFAANSPGSEASTELRSFLSLDLAADRLLSPLDIINSPTAPLRPTNFPLYVVHAMCFVLLF